MSKYLECSIQGSSAGFGEYQRGEANGEAWDDLHALIFAMRENCGGEIYQLGVDTLPEGIDDIRGSIQNEPDHVFVVVIGDYTGYIGIVEA